ncbi:MAG: hypothetical protein RBT16_13255 [Desulfococcus multivorans]|nr:hypothetical protein [Desulfococcus multivorans]
MNTLLKLLTLVLLAGSSACSLYFTVPLQTYLIAKGPDVGAPALPYFAYADTTLEIIDREFRNAGASVTIEDVYVYAYGKPFQDIPPDGDTGQRFADMAAATDYLQKILKAKGLPDAESYFLTSIDSAKRFGFTLIAAVQREGEEITVFDKFGASSKTILACDALPYYQPFRYNCDGDPLDTVYEWAAVPDDCFDKQGHQAILLALTANKLLEKTPKEDYWAAERKWIAGNYESVVIDQDYMVCQALGIEEGYVEQKNLFKD